jgi:hypothetical protein
LDFVDLEGWIGFDFVDVKGFEIGFLLWFQSRSIAALAITRYSPIQL